MPNNSNSEKPLHKNTSGHLAATKGFVSDIVKKLKLWYRVRQKMKQLKKQDPYIYK